MLEMTILTEDDYQEHAEEVFYGIGDEKVFPPNDLPNLDTKNLDIFDVMSKRFVQSYK